MTLFRGLFVRKDATRGTSAVEARKALAGIFLPGGAHGARPGVLDGLTVAGTAGWAYSVAAGYVVLSRSAADGAILAGNDAGASVSTSPAPASGSRIDLIWLKHSDVDAGDPTSEITLGVTEGTAAASPVAPVLPTGAFELARATVAAGASSTSHASVTIAATATRTGMRGGQVTAPTLASLEALYPSAPDGLTAWVTSENGVYVRSGGQWRLLWQDTGWKTLAVSTGWSVTNPVQVRRIDVRVYLRGIVQASAANPTTILAENVIPDHARPIGQNPVFAVASNATAAGRVTVGTNGSATYAGAIASGQYVYLNGVSYPVG